MIGKFQTTLAIGALLWANSVFAYPKNPALKTIDNDGFALTIQNFGDEHYSFTQTLDGFLVIQKEGVYYYADENGEASSMKAKNFNLQNEQEKAYLKSVDEKKVKESHAKKNGRKFQAEKKERASWIPSVSDKPKLRLPNPAGHSYGTNRFPVILVETNDTKNCDSLEFYNQVNQNGYSKNGHIGSVKDYFTAQSNGFFVPSYDIYLVKVDKNISSYKENEQYLVKESLEKLRAKYPQFNAQNYDADNDGFVDAVAIMYAGTEAAANNVGGFAYNLKYNAVGQQDAGNGKKFDAYFILAQMISNTTLAPIAQFIHEFSHTMGLQDHYCVYGSECYQDFTNTEYQCPSVHGWDVMATGMYNGPSNGATPVGYSAFEKQFMHWIEYETLTTTNDVTIMNPLNSSNQSYKIPVAGNNDEWFVLENRQTTDWDKYLPNSGLLIWHIDYDQAIWDSDALNDDKTHQRIDVVEAGNIKVNSYYDGFYSGYGGENLADDVFPGSQNVTSFDGFYSWNGIHQGVSLYNITEANQKICFTTKSGIAVNNCEVQSSSSFEISSSSENPFIESSSSYEPIPFSSSSEEPWFVFSSSSSETETSLQDLQKILNRIDVIENTLSIETSIAGTKQISLFDVTGHTILQKSFHTNSFELDLQKINGKVLIVKLSQGKKILQAKKISIR